MIQTEIIKSMSGKLELIKTYTTVPESKKLLQIETNQTYLNEVVDVIVGYNQDKLPISKYNYKEIDKTPQDLEYDKKLAEVKNKRRVLTNVARK